MKDSLMDKQAALDSLIESLATLTQSSNVPGRFMVEVSPPSYSPEDFIVKSQIVINGVNVGSANVKMK